MLRVVALLSVLTLASADVCSNLAKDMVIGANFIANVPNVSDVGACCKLCVDHDGCLAFTYDLNSNSCFLKDNIAGNTTEPNRISGVSGRQPNNDGWDACTGSSARFPFCNTELSMAERLDDLISRIPLNITGAQLTARQSAAVPEVGLPSYYWGTNAIHGMQNTVCLPNGQCPTSFPCPNGLAASFNTSLAKDMGRIIGREMRAYYNDRFHNSLDTWSPTINPSRDPRWGRNVESPGESPYVCGQYGGAYAEGLQYGGDDSVTQVIVSLKHWVAYSLEGYEGVTRHTFDANVSEYDLTETYFPAWEHLVKDVGALGVMCSYNMLNGKPTCGNPDLTAILREDWGFQGYITSDSDSIRDIYDSHHYEPDAVHAVRDGLEAGCDIDSGSTYKDNIEATVTSGLVDKKYSDAALFRSYRARFQLGLFDPNVSNVYKKITTAEVGMASSQAVSEQASRKVMTLLKNDGDTLPFPKGAKVALIGKSSNTSEDLLGNYIGPICPSGKYECVDTLYQGMQAINTGGSVTVNDDVDDVSAAVAAAQAADYVVLTISNVGQAGEGKDRVTIDLADDQKKLVAAVQAVGKPVAIVMINGGLISIDSIKESAKAILVAFAPGVYGAKAIAETIFGDNNPGGKLPVTMYPANYINEADFLNMSMQAGPGRSYKYYTGTPLFPFGFGLSYTTFDITWAPSPPNGTIFRSTQDTQTYTATVTNTGKRAGDEVVMAYYKPQADSFRTLPLGTPVAKKDLFGFARVTLEPGESTQVEFSLDGKTLAMVTKDGHKELHSGVFEIALTRGHGPELVASASMQVDKPVRLSTFRKWW
eukprot:m.111852 g.111852  ORF g.111852 m.111852 type:complete len:819 (-) comp15400_c0_seq1:93-2549(-)